MTAQELEVLIAHTTGELYRTALDNDLTDAEYDYFMHSVLYQISASLRNSAYKTMKNEIGEGVN